MEAAARPVAPFEGGIVRPAHWRWNFGVLGGDVGFFTLGLSISSAQTILPLFVHHLTASNEAVALIAAVRAFGGYGPQLLVAPLVERIKLAKPLILAITIFERLPYLALAFGSIWLAEDHPGILLGMFFALLFIQQLSSGLSFPAWVDLIARTIPSDWRGRFFGWWQGAGGLAGIGGAALAAAIIARVAWPMSFAMLFGLTFVTFIISFVLLALGREPARLVANRAAPSSHASTREFGRAVASVVNQNRDLVRVVRGDSGLGWLLVGNAAAGVSTMGGALYAVAALRDGGLSAIDVSVESTVLVVATTAGYFLWGALGDRLGHRVVLMGAVLCAAGGSMLALGARGFVPYAVVFLLLGLSLSATSVGQLTFVTELAPVLRRPTYIAIASVAYAPFAVGAPIIGGWMADRWGYGPVFVVSVIAALVGVAVFAFRVPDSRTHAMKNAELHGSTGVS